MQAITTKYLPSTHINKMTLNERLQYHVSGAIQRGEAKAIAGIPADTNDILTDSLADASYWKGEARKAQAAKVDLLAALQTVLSTYRTFRNVPKDLQEWTCIDDEAFEQGLSAIAKAKGGA